MTTRERPGSIVIGPSDLTDDGLARLLRTHRRAIEDDANGAPAAEHWIKAVRREQLVRFRLKMRYGAVENHVGTASYDRYYRFGEAPAYELAKRMDYAAHLHGRRHCLHWPSV